MNQDEQFMLRCLELASNGLGQVAPNPLVGSVVVYENQILGEGYHANFGAAHAEVNAINAVKDEKLLTKATLYINLEPCCHHGKTPACTDLIIKKGIPKVVIGTADPYHEVSGKGIEILKKQGIDVVVDVLSEECLELNKRFFTFQQQQRPYVILKWAQTLDGFMAREEGNDASGWITNDESKRLVHQWRGQEQAIMVGTNTALKDNPQLTTRLFSGKNPLRVTLDQKDRLPDSLHLLDGQTPTLVFTEQKKENSQNLTYQEIDFSTKPLEQIMQHLADSSIQSIIVEGGRNLLNTFITANCWDEARIFIGNKTFTAGILAPVVDLSAGKMERINDDRLFILKNSN